MSAPTDKHPGPTSGSGRASPLVTASQVLDKYIQLSSQPKSAETAAMPHGKAHKVKSGVKQEHRQGLVFYGSVLSLLALCIYSDIYLQLVVELCCIKHLHFSVRMVLMSHHLITKAWCMPHS